MKGSFPKLKLVASNTHDLHKDIVLYFKTNQQIPKGESTLSSNNTGRMISQYFYIPRLSLNQTGTAIG